MLYKELRIPAKSSELFVREWKPETDIRGIVCLVHGLGDHSGRYVHVAKALTAAGFVLLALDLWGHGRSPGKRGHMPNFRFFMDDIQALLQEAKKRHPNSDYYLYGHSMGGNLVANYVLRKKPELAGVIITSPWLRLQNPPSPTLINVLKLLNFVHPAFTQPNGLRSTDLSHDRQTARVYDKDPLVHSKISAGTFVKVSQAGEWAISQAHRFALPLLLMHGDADRITSPQASQEFAANVPYCTLKMWDGLFHELHNEPEQGKVLRYLIKWLQDQQVLRGNCCER